MTAGRTHPKWLRVLMDGYDMSGYSRMIGPAGVTFDEGIDDALSLTVKGVLSGNAVVSIGALNGLFDNTATSGLHVIASGAGTVRDVMACVGIQAAPANNDPVFVGQFLQTGYMAGPDGNPITATIPLANTSVLAGSRLYGRAWGRLLHALAATTAANSATGLDEGGQTTRGGFMMYQVTAAAGTGTKTATIKVQDADTNSDGDFADLLSSGEINCAPGVSGVVALDPGATVEQYVRWQLALNTASSVTFALAWVRGN